MTEYFEREKPIDGAFQTHSIHTAAFTTKLPESISFEQAATIPSTMLTAAVGFHAFAELPENYDETTHNNEWFLVWGGASSCGVSAIQLAKLLGFKVVATASPHSFEYVKSYGAEIVLDYNDSEISNKIREVTGGALRYAYEAVSSEGITAKIGKAMSEQGGSIVTVNAGFNEKNVVPDSVKVLPFSCLEMFNVSLLLVK
jgi:NADPH:quinone reductase-like Zn-dependent oxidoreductase